MVPVSREVVLRPTPVVGAAPGTVSALVGRVPSAEASGRLLRAQAALARAEERAGLRSVRERGVAVPDVRGPGTALRLPQVPVGVTRVVGSTAAVLSLAARAQGPGWCAVLGGEDLGWCAAAELGLELERVVCVPVGEHGPARLLQVLGALLDGVDLLLVTATAASRLQLQGRRRLLARVREREARLITDGPWEGARLLVAQPGSAPEGAVVVPMPGLLEGAGGTAPASAQELEPGRLEVLTWVLTDPSRRVGVRLEVTGSGAVWGQLDEALPPALGGASRWQERGAV